MIGVKRINARHAALSVSPSFGFSVQASSQLMTFMD
jgi:hypothetical protein